MGGNEMLISAVYSVLLLYQNKQPTFKMCCLKHYSLGRGGGAAAPS